jgi:hypothetical protein
MNKLVRGILSVVAMVILTASVAGAAANPVGIPYQGRLTDASGAVINGARDLTLTLYDSDSNVIYAETQAGVTVTNGLFSIEIGLGTPTTGSFGAINFKTNDLYLGITVGTDPEMTPRIHLGLAPFAMHAADAPGLATGHVAGLPPFFIGGSISIPATAGDLISTTITVPTAGYVIVWAGGQVNTAAAGYVSMWLSASAGSGRLASDYGFVGVPTAQGYFQFERHKVFQVSAGTSTFYLAGQIESGAAGSYIWQPTITALFVPSALGGIGLAPPTAAGAVANQPGEVRK